MEAAALVVEIVTVLVSEDTVLVEATVEVVAMEVLV